MKKFIINKNLIIGFIITLLNSCSSQQPVYKSLWQTNKFTSPDNKELHEALRFCDKKSKLQYSITNDSKNIYICIKATDEQYQMKIIRAGMQVNIDTTSKEEQEISILYPLASIEKPKMPVDMKSGLVKDKKNNPMKTQFLLEHKEMQLSGFKSPINGLVSLQNNYGIFVNIDWDSLNIMYYKAIIPFCTFYKETLTLPDSSKIFNFSFIVNAMEMPDNKMEGPPGGGEMPGGGSRNMQGGGMGEGEMGGGGGMGNGGPPPGGGGAGMRADNSLSEKNVIKAKIRMAVK
jgi:hypothetical protein